MKKSCDDKKEGGNWEQFYAHVLEHMQRNTLCFFFSLLHYSADVFLQFVTFYLGSFLQVGIPQGSTLLSAVHHHLHSHLMAYVLGAAGLQVT